MTFDEITEEAQSYTKDKSNAAKAVIQKGINDALSKLRKRMRRKYTFVTRGFAFEPGQSKYQMPENLITLDRISYIEGGDRTQLHRVDSGDEWERMKSQTGETGTPQFFYVLSSDLFEVYPTPSAADTTGLLKYKARAKRLSIADYSTGTISVTSGSQTVTGTGTAFTAKMVGQHIKLENPESDKSDYYQIIAVDTDDQELTLENYYDGYTKTNENYRIGQVPDLPEEYHSVLADYGMYRFYLWRKDKQMASEFQANFLQSFDEAGSEDDVTSTVIPSRRARGDDNIPSYMRTPRAVQD